MIAERYLTPEHIAFRDTVRRFVKDEIAPHVSAWDEAETFPRELYARAAQLGLLQMGYAEQYGGIEADHWLKLISTTEFAYAGCGGLVASLFSHNIGLPPVALHGTDALKARVIPPVLRGEKISALAITEPGGGSDVAALRTRATDAGDHYVVNGEKTFITSGVRADFYTVAVRTGEAHQTEQKGGAGGVSLLLLEKGMPGFTTAPLKKMGWWCSDTAHLTFDNVQVPKANLIGEENKGFRAIMHNFNGERLMMSAIAWANALACYDDALTWARDRKTFGSALIEKQVIRHKFADMKMRLDSTRAWIEDIVWRTEQNDTRPETVAQISLLKNHATQTMQHCADQAVQIMGGMGFMRGHRVERIYREVKVMMIGGGAEEIMKDLAARQLGL
jgi:acyl-CoA dehydrogenase